MTDHTAVFRPRARLIKILGEHLIRDNAVGVLELIKNSYDADAENVLLQISNTKNPEKTEVLIKDDGIGMDIDIIQGRWFEPAHGAKDESKKRSEKTSKGRIPLGEKGVGRFAVQKLGKKLELVTRPKGKDYELYMKLDWDRFDDSDKFINEIQIPFSKRSPVVFKGKDSHGTQLTVLQPRDAWKPKDVERLQANLIRLQSPGETDEDFMIAFRCPEYRSLENLDKSDILERYQFKIECEIDKKGFLHYKYNEREGTGENIDASKTCDLWTEVRDKDRDNNPQCGSFHVTIYAWLLETASLKNYGITREHLKELSGISIYRDGFRILPYGDPGDDWLQLDQRRINVPASRLGNRQVIGFVDLDQTTNSNLIDKTNREGLWENDAFFDMKTLVLGCIAKLENECYGQRQKHKQTKKEKAELTIGELKKEIDELKQAAKPQVDEKPADTAPEKTQESAEEIVIIPKQKLAELEEKSELAYGAMQEYIESEEDDREAFLHLMGVGLAAERFSHEFERMVSSISQSIGNLLKKYGNDDDLKEMQLTADTLKNEIRLMSAMRYVKGSPAEGKTSVGNILNLIMLIRQDDLKQNNIEVSKETDISIFTRMPGYSVAQILDNILSNAIHWLAQKSDKRDRKLSVYSDPATNSLIITNNGPSMPPTIQGRVFKFPFVTTKASGRGLGLFICSELLSRYKGKISFISKEDDPRVLNIGFKVDFPVLVKH